MGMKRVSSTYVIAAVDVLMYNWKPGVLTLNCERLYKSGKP